MNVRKLGAESNFMETTKHSATGNLVFFGLLALALAVYVFVLRPLGRSSDGLTHPALGALLPEISVNSLVDPSTNVTNADLDGKVVLINFWATWCPGCIQELPHLEKIQAKFGENPHFQMLSVTTAEALNEDEVRTQTEQFLGQRELSLPAYIDQGSAAFVAIMKATNGKGEIPYTVAVDRGGVIRGIWSGYLPGYETAMESLVQQLLDDSRAKNSPEA